METQAAPPFKTFFFFLNETATGDVYVVFNNTRGDRVKKRAGTRRSFVFFFSRSSVERRFIAPHVEQAELL